MELNEAARRILGRHWALILAFVVLGAGSAAFVNRRDVSIYTSSARLVLDTPDPRSSTESAAIADTARAIVTSPALVGEAIATAKVTGRNPLEVAKEDVSLQALGTSGILQLSVRDRNPLVATAIANALATGLIQTRLDVTRGHVQRVLGDLDVRIDQLNRKISTIDAQIDDLNVRAATARSPVSANSLRAKRDDLARLRDFLAQQRLVLETQRGDLLTSDAMRPEPAVISAASPPPRPDHSGRVQNIVLGGLLGLVLGVGLAGLIETFRPTVVGGSVLAKELGAPLLGELNGGPDGTDSSDLIHISSRLRLAAASVGVRRVDLAPVRPEVDLTTLVERLAAVPATVAVPGELLTQMSASGRSPRIVGTLEAPRTQNPPVATIRVFGGSPSPLSNGDGAGLVLVSPSTVKKSELFSVSNLLLVTRWPLLGIITYRGPRWSRGRRRSRRPVEQEARSS